MCLTKLIHLSDQAEKGDRDTGNMVIKDIIITMLPVSRSPFSGEGRGGEGRGGEGRGGMAVIHIVIGMFTSNPMIPQYLNNIMT